MEKQPTMRTFHGSLAMKSRTNRDIDAYFSSYLTIDDPIFELTSFNPHNNKSFSNNQVHNHHIQKLIPSNTTRVSPLGDVIVTHHAHATNSTDPSLDYAVTTTTTTTTSSSSVAASSEAKWNNNNSNPDLFPLLSGVKSSVSMSNQPRSVDLRKKIKASFTKPVRLCRRKCPCADKKAVQVKEMKPSTKTKVPPPPPPPSFPSHNPRVLNHKSKDLESNPRISIEKSTMLETAAKKSDVHNKTPISPNNIVNQKPSNHDVPITKSQILKPENDAEASTISQPQKAMSFVKPITDGFTFPLLNPKSVQEDPPCNNSLEAFVPYSEPSSVSQSPKSGMVDDDAASDASSDLFEIVSFPTQATTTQSGTNSDAKPLDTVINSGFVFKSKESVTRTITEKHKPSREASIDWSMSSGEGFEFDKNGVIVKPSDFVDSPLSMCQTAQLSLTFAT